MEHPGDIFEAASLAAINLPPTDFPLWDSLPAEVVDKGLLSRLQLEAVLYACTVRLVWTCGAVLCRDLASSGHICRSFVLTALFPPPAV